MALAEALAAALAVAGTGALGDLGGAGPPGGWPEPAYLTGILDAPDPVPGLGRYVVHGPGGARTAALDAAGAAALRASGARVAPDLMVDLHGAPAGGDVSRLAELTGGLRAAGLGYDGSGIVVAVADTGVDFSNPDLRHSLARGRGGEPLMLDADGQGIVLTNATFVADIDEHGILRTFRGEAPANATSTVYRGEGGVYLDLERGGAGTRIEIYNALFPHNGLPPVFNGTVSDDMRIGSDGRDYIRSESGVYRLGIMYQGWPGGPRAGLQVVPVLVVDSEEAGVYDTIIPDMSTSWEDYSTDGAGGDYDFDFTDEEPVRLGSGSEFLVYDSDGDGEDDYSAGTAGARVVDVFGAVSGVEARLEGALGAANGTLLPAMDPNGTFFGVMTDPQGHGTASAAAIASSGGRGYDVYGNGTLYSAAGAAPGASILPVKSLWLGDTLYAAMWTAGFDAAGGGWEYSGLPRADVMSNSWGVPAFPALGAAPGKDPVSLVYGALSVPRSLHPDYPGIVVVSSAGNDGHGYGTVSPPGASPFGITAGAVTSSAFVGHGPFAGQPRFGNDTGRAGHLADFSSRGPTVVGDAKPDLVSVGAFGLVPAEVTPPRGDDGGYEPVGVFGGTSMAAPLVAGAAAVLMQAMQDAGEPYTPSRVKSVLMSAAADTGNDPHAQGAGAADASAAVRFALREPGSFAVHAGGSYAALVGELGPAYEALNRSAYGLGGLEMPASGGAGPSWYAGKLHPGGRATAELHVENPSDSPVSVRVEPVALRLAERREYSGATEPGARDADLRGPGAFAPNYLPLRDLRGHERLADYFAGRGVPEGAGLLDLKVVFPIGGFMPGGTAPGEYAGGLQIASLYLYDWEDDDGDGEPSSSELSMVSRAGSWGTVQEMRVGDPGSAFSGVPLVGVYPVPSRHSYWTGETRTNSTPIAYEAAASYYYREPWGDVWVSSPELEVPPRGSASVRATVAVPEDRQPGSYAGFVRFSSGNQTSHVPVGYAVAAPVAAAGDAASAAGGGGGPRPEGELRGAVNMLGRYMAGDWQQFHFDVQDPGIDAAAAVVRWADPGTHVAAFAVDPAGRVAASSVPPGVFGEFLGWPTSDWLGPTPASEGGGFYPVSSVNETATAMFVPINSTGVWSVLAHGGQHGGEAASEPVEASARFTSVP